MENNNNENCIEFLGAAHTMTVSFTNRKYINKIMKLHKEHPDDFKFFHQNKDGSICATLPLKWLKISPPKKVSEEQRQAASERFKKMHEGNKL